MISCYDKIWSCIQAVLAMVCERNGVDNEPLLVMALGIVFDDSNNKAFYRKIKPQFIFSIEELIEDVFGWNIISNMWISQQITLEAVKINLSKKYSVVLGIDVMYCPWNLAYGIRTGLHYCIVESCCDEKKILYIGDPYSGECIYELKYEDFEKGKMQLLVFEVLLNDKIPEEIRDIFIKKLYNKNSIIEYEKLKNNLIQIRSFGELFESEKIEACRLIIDFKQIGNYYKGVSLYINKFGIRYQGLYECLQRIQKEWEIFENILIRMHISRMVTLKKIEGLCERLDLMIECEKQLNACILKLTY